MPADDDRLDVSKEDLEGVRKTAEFALGKYFQSAKAVRTWFLAYGIGAPAIVISQKHFLEALVAHTALFVLACVCFSLGVLIQIAAEITWKRRVACLSDKYRAIYVAAAGESKKETKEAHDSMKKFENPPRLTALLSSAGADWVTLALFIGATGLAVLAIVL